MKARTRLKLLVVLVVAMAASLIAGCSIGMESYEETLALYNLTAQVTYYSNGGCFDSNTDVLVKRIGYKDGTPFYEVTSTTANAKVIYSNHIYSGWYYAASQTIDDVLYFECDLNGYEADDYYYEDDDNDDEIVYCIKEQSGKYLISKDDYEELILIRTSTSSQIVPLLEYGDEVDASSLVLADGDSLYVVAMWTTAQAIEYKLLIDGGDADSSITITNEDETTTTYKQGDTLKTEYFSTQPTVSLYDGAVVEFSGYTWVGNFTDEDCNNLVSSVARPDEGNVILYVLYVENVLDEKGNLNSWTIIKNASQVADMFLNHNGYYYIATDIDCSSLGDDGVSPMASITGYIRGNGHTISNLTINTANLSNTSNTALFGRLMRNAKIYDVTFENWTFNVNIKVTLTTTNINMYLIAYSAQDISTNTLQNVTFKGIQVDIITNGGSVLVNDGYLTTDNWWCYGYTNAEFAEAFPDVTIIDCEYREIESKT